MPRRRTLTGMAVIAGTCISFLKLPSGPYSPHSVLQKVDTYRDPSLYGSTNSQVCQASLGFLDRVYR